MSGDEDPGEVALVTRLFEGMGASGPQAGGMARQLLKRARQLAGERGSDREEELRYLLDLIVAGREGRPIDDRMRSRGGPEEK